MLLDTKEAAKVLGVSASLMKRWRADGTGPRFVQVGPRLIRYADTDLKAFEASLGRCRSTAEAFEHLG
jgi:predicted DNA-binding transcriptional regulator AlpA